jgi:hypothetical protein
LSLLRIQKGKRVKLSWLKEWRKTKHSSRSLWRSVNMWGTGVTNLSFFISIGEQLKLPNSFMEDLTHSPLWVCGFSQALVSNHQKVVSRRFIHNSWDELNS